ncbi:pyruvate dehydrogenase complex dihydrolipoamide acetyltransferase, partial [Mesorhizobium sp. M1E.F.Ca.ET.063.01.1.1]
MKRPISPLEGEMSPKATEGVAARGAPALSVARNKAGALRETTPLACRPSPPQGGRSDARPLSPTAAVAGTAPST